MAFLHRLKASPSNFTHGLVVKSLENVRDPIDPGISLSSRPDAEELDHGLARQLCDFVRHQDHDQQHLTSATDLEKASTLQEPLYVRIGHPLVFGFV